MKRLGLLSCPHRCPIAAPSLPYTPSNSEKMHGGDNNTGNDPPSGSDSPDDSPSSTVYDPADPNSRTSSRTAHSRTPSDVEIVITSDNVLSVLSDTYFCSMGSPFVDHDDREAKEARFRKFLTRILPMQSPFEYDKIVKSVYTHLASQRSGIAVIPDFLNTLVKAHMFLHSDVDVEQTTIPHEIVTTSPPSSDAGYNRTPVVAVHTNVDFAVVSSSITLMADQVAALPDEFRANFSQLADKLRSALVEAMARTDGKLNSLRTELNNLRTELQEKTVQHETESQSTLQRIEDLNNSLESRIKTHVNEALALADLSASKKALDVAAAQEAAMLAALDAQGTKLIAEIDALKEYVLKRAPGTLREVLNTTRDDLCALAGFERIYPSVNDKTTYSYSLFEQQKRLCKPREKYGPNEFASARDLENEIMKRCEARLANSTAKEETEYKRIFSKGFRSKEKFKNDLDEFKRVVFLDSETCSAGNLNIHATLSPKETVMEAIEHSAVQAERASLISAANAVFEFRTVDVRSKEVAQLQVLVAQCREEATVIADKKADNAITKVATIVAENVRDAKTKTATYSAIAAKAVADAKGKQARFVASQKPKK